MSEPLALSQVTAHIAAHASEEDLARITEVTKERRKALAAIAAAAVTRGASVEIVNISPAAYKGKRGTVEKITDARRPYASVKLTPESTKDLRWTGRVTIPDEATEWTVTGIPLTCLRLL